MKTAPLVLAQLSSGDPAAQRHHAAQGGDGTAQESALHRANRVFLTGNDLPARWAGRTRFVVLETGLGAGFNFLATWKAWRSDPCRPERLVYMAVEKHPYALSDLRRCHAEGPMPELADQLFAQWPVATPDLHTLAFEDGAVTLLLALGDIQTWLPELVAQVDAFYLDGFAPSVNAEMWTDGVTRACARLAAPDAMIATWHRAPPLPERLSAAGFDVTCVAPDDPAPQRLTARLRAQAARHHPNRMPAGRRAAPSCRSALVIGAGLAGAAAGRALAAQGLRVTVLERNALPADETSGNPAGLFHPVVHANDGAHAQLLRAACHRSSRLIQHLVRQGLVPGDVGGLLRTVAGSGEEAQVAGHTLRQMADWVQRLGLPDTHVQAWSQHQAAAEAGVPLTGPAWWFPQAGWVSPPALVRQWLTEPGIHLQTQAVVTRIRSMPADGTGAQPWQALDASGQVLAQADVLVLANAEGLLPLLAGCEPAAADWPLKRSRGQISWWPSEAASAASLPLPARPVAGGGYAIGLPASLGGGLLCGATNQPDDAGPEVRAADHLANLTRLADLLGQPLDTQAALAASPQGRVGWRLACDDRLPIVGPVPLPAEARGQLLRQEQARHVPRIPGLYILSALGSRGITWAPLLGEALAAWITGAPQPLPASLLDAVDVARFAARATRKAAPKPAPA